MKCLFKLSCPYKSRNCKPESCRVRSTLTLEKPVKDQKGNEVLSFIRQFNPAIFRGRKGLRELKDILLDYQIELKKHDK